MPQSRIPASSCPVIILLLLLAPWARGNETAEDTHVFAHEVNGVKAELYLPPGVEEYRGLLLHVANYRLNTSNRWAVLAQELHFGHLVLTIDMKRNNRPRLLREALFASLEHFAQETAQPELADALLVGIGHSAGGMVLPVLRDHPQRLLTAAIDCGWISEHHKLPEQWQQTPLLFTIGAIPDGFNMIPNIDDRFVPARADGWLYGLGFEWGKAHNFANAAALFVPWIKEVVAHRLPLDAEPRDFTQEQGWLGDRSTWDQPLPTVASWDDYSAQRSTAIWFPGPASAAVWQAYQVKDAPLHLAVSAEGQELPAFRVNREQSVTIPQGEKITLGLHGDPSADPAVEQVTWYAGDRELAQATEAPWTAHWDDAPPGVHSVYARYQRTDGQEAVTNPALLVIPFAAP